MSSAGDSIVSVEWAIRSLPEAKVLAGGTAATLDAFLFHNPAPFGRWTGVEARCEA